MIFEVGRFLDLQVCNVINRRAGLGALRFFHHSTLWVGLIDAAIFTMDALRQLPPSYIKRSLFTSPPSKPDPVLEAAKGKKSEKEG